MIRWLSWASLNPKLFIFDPCAIVGVDPTLVFLCPDNSAVVKDMSFIERMSVRTIRWVVFRLWSNGEWCGGA